MDSRRDRILASAFGGAKSEPAEEPRLDEERVRAIVREELAAIQALSAKAERSG